MAICHLVNKQMDIWISSYLCVGHRYDGRWQSGANNYGEKEVVDKKELSKKLSPLRRAAVLMACRGCP